jgi:glycosyltransferase involved in cell wall biosynthesis
MRVAVDARRMQDRPLGGVGRMLANLLPLVEKDVDLILLTDARRDAADGPLSQHALRPPGPLPETVWLQVFVARWLRGFDGVFHGSFNAVPIASSVPAVVTFNDLAYEDHHEDFRPDKRLAWRVQARLAARVARVVTTLTLFVRDGLVDRYGIDPAKVLLTPPAVDPVFSPSRRAHAERVLRPLGVDGPYVVALGGARRRGLEVAVAAWRRLRTAGSDWSLVVAGPEAPPASPGIVHAGVLDDEEWAAVLAGAEVFCYPTRYEGFGMPALESVASGTPVVCARVGPLPEVLGDAAEWCADTRLEAIADGLARLAGNVTRRESLVGLGLARAKAAPTWSESAATLVQAYRMAAEG